jgi:hypothetical protein
MKDAGQHDPARLVRLLVCRRLIHPVALVRIHATPEKLPGWPDNSAYPPPTYMTCKEGQFNRCVMPVQNIAFKTRLIEIRAVTSEISVATSGTARKAA